MKRKFLSLLLCLSLALSLTLPAAAAVVDLDNAFPPVYSYTGFSDVSSTSWYLSYVTTCYETGLMQGVSATTFSPNSFLTVAQVATLGARIHSLANGGDGIISTSGEKWYSGAITYISNLAKADGTSLGTDILALLSSPSTNVSRDAFLQILALVTPDSYLTPINTITVLPDSTDVNVLNFYNAGILTGMDDYGTFKGSYNLTRAEASAMIARLVDSDQRIAFAPLSYDLFWAAEVNPTDLFFATGVTAETYLLTVMELIFELETACLEQDIPFNWNNTYGGVLFTDYVTNTAISALGVNTSISTTTYKNFDLQTFYAAIVDQIVDDALTVEAG